MPISVQSLRLGDQQLHKFTSGKAFFIKGQPYWDYSLTLIDNQA